MRGAQKLAADMTPYRVYFIASAVWCYVWQTSAWRSPTCHRCEVVVQLDSGPICGSVRLAENTTEYYSFRGIPYAKPPVGAMRFAELEPCDPWTEPLLTVEDGPACPQLDIFYGSIPANPYGLREDCMYANVHVPVTAKLNLAEGEQGLPILVNVHGGGYQTGSGNTDLHGPEYFMYKGGVIIMSFNYRIAVFGFLSLGSDKIPGNNGLRDVYTFLKWIQKNGRSFGGNPNDVTLLGQSVGGTLVHLLTLSKATNGLFQRAIIMSGTAIPNSYSASPKHAKNRADLFLNAAGINSTDPDLIHQQLIDMPLDNIMYANSIAQNMSGLTTFVPVVEGDHAKFTKILDDEPLNLMRQGRGLHIPFIIGFTNNEGVFFRRVVANMNALERLRQNHEILLSLRLVYTLSPEVAQKSADKIFERYFNESFTLDKFLEFVGDSFFLYPAIKLAQIRAAMGGAAYLYEYGYENEFSMVKRALWLQYSGASHLEDLAQVFRTNTLVGDHVSFPPKTEDDHMKDWMTDFALNFIPCNNPTCVDDASSPWPRVAHNKLRLLSVAKPKVYKMKTLVDRYRSMVNFFDSIDPDLRRLSKELHINTL